MNRIPGKKNYWTNTNKDGRESNDKLKIYQKWKEKWKDQWITSVPDNDMIKFADEQAKIMKKLTTSQIRNFFSEVVRIKEKGIENEKLAFLMLKPKIAYAAKRSANPEANLFKEIMTKSIDLVIAAENNPDEYKKRFTNFHALFEALLAYHKVHGGK